MKELTEMTLKQLLDIYIEEAMELEGCSTAEAREGVTRQIKEFLIKEIEWIGEMNGK